MAEMSRDPFRAFYDRALSPVYGYLHVRLMDPARSEAVTRSVFAGVVELWPFPANIRDEVSVAIGMARRELVAEYRRQARSRRRRLRRGVAQPVHRGDAELDRAYSTLGAIPAHQRAALVLRRLDDLSLADVAGILGKSQRATRSLLTQASGRLPKPSAGSKSLVSKDDPLVQLRALEGPVAPPQEFAEQLYQSLVEIRNRTPITAPQVARPPPTRRGPLVTGGAAMLLLVGLGLLWWPGLSGAPELSGDVVLVSAPAGPLPTGRTEVPGRVRAAGDPAAGDYEFGGWRVLPPSPFDGRRGASVAWTGARVIVWGGALAGSGTPAENGGPLADDGGVFDPTTDRWVALPPAPLSPRAGAVTLWIGEELLIIGGSEPELPTLLPNPTTKSGAAYNPATRQWRELPAHSVALDPAAVWTGSEAILFPGVNSPGAAYNPSTDSWRSIPHEGTPTVWDDPGAVWTGSEMIVWNGVIRSGPPSADQPWALGIAAFDPESDSWRRFEPLPAGLDLDLITGVWTGDELLLWGRNQGGGSDGARPGGVALDPATGMWRRMALPRFSTDDDPRFTETVHSVVWTGSRMLVWVGGNHVSATGAELWEYDPVADHWQRGATSPLLSGDPALIWTGDSVFAYGSGNSHPLERTLWLNLGPSGDGLPPLVGTEIPIYLLPSLPFEMLAIAPATGQVATLDFSRRIVTSYEITDTLLQRRSLESVLPLGEGWMTLADGLLWWFPDGIARVPSTLLEASPVEIARLAHMLPIGGQWDADRIWTVAPGPGRTRIDEPSIIRQIEVATGEQHTVTAAPPDVTPVVASSRGLLLNQHGWIEADGSFVEDPASRMMLLVRPDGTLEQLWAGQGIHLADNALVWLDCNAAGGNCRIVISELRGIDGRYERSLDRIIEDPDGSYGAGFQPGIATVSPDGTRLVAERVPGDGSGEISLVLIDLETDRVSELISGRRIGTDAGPGVVWSADSEWVVVLDGRPTAIRVADGARADLWEWVPANMSIYAVASR